MRGAYVSPGPLAQFSAVWCTSIASPMVSTVHPRALVSLAIVLGACAAREPPRPLDDAGPATSRDAAVTAPTIVSAAPPASSGPAMPAPPPASASASASASPPAAPPGMLLVPEGTTVVGQDEQGELDERPAHKVTLPAFWLDETEVTNEAYQRCVEARVCQPPDPKSARANKLGDDKQFRRPRQPVSSISHDDARAYCQHVGKRLPTEAEWERAARGDDGRTYPWGEAFPTKAHAVFGEGTTADVGSRPAGKGPFGHLDLAGNVWEWVEDHYDPYAYRRAGAAEGKPGTCDEIMATLAELKRGKMQGFTGSNPIPDECERVLRGGAFNYHAKGLRASNRVHHPGRFHLVMSGFRCAMNVAR